MDDYVKLQYNNKYKYSEIKLDVIPTYDISSPIDYSILDPYEKDLIKNGFKLVIYANQLLRAAYPAMKFAATKILENGRSFEIENKIIPIKKIINLIQND